MVSTQVASSCLAPRVPAIWGRATLAMEVSSTSINVARVTVSAINQGLCLGCHPSTEAGWTGFGTGFRCAANVVVANASSRDPVELFFLIVKVRRESAGPLNLVDQPAAPM